MKQISALLILLCSINICISQSLPKQMHYSSDGRILYTGGIIAESGFYDKNTIKNVYLNFSQSNYWNLLTSNYNSETNLEASMVYDGVTYPQVGVRFRGNTSYMMTGNSQKKSFAVETDFVNEDQTVLGYKNLKFNNAHDDATFMREVLYGRMAARHTPIARTNYIHLYLNNQDWGIYPNIQSIDKTFLEEWFLSNDGARFRATVEETGPGPGNWGDGTAGMNYLGANAASYQQYYTLKSNDVVEDPWQTLIDASYQLSVASASDLESLKAKIDVDKVLWHLACENVFTDDDSYIMKGKMDYMIYFEPETGRTTSLEYDGNTTFVSNAATSSSWGPFKNATNAKYPLLYKLLGIPELRQRYLAHYRTILNETFTTANATALVNELHSQIGTLVASDPKKLYSTAQYTNGYPGLISFVTNRRNFLLSNAEVAQTAPVISAAPYYNQNDQEYTNPLPEEPVTVKATVTSANGIKAVFLYYATGLVGNFSKVQMFDDGQHDDGASNDGVFGGNIPGYIANTLVRYYIEAIANNSAASAAYLPTGAEHDIFVYHVESENASNGVVINELLAQNTSVVTDEAGDYEDWVELYNNNDFEVDLSAFYLSDKTENVSKWSFPEGTVIPANGYLIVWADEEQEEGDLHANFKLSASGESVTLSDPLQNLVDQVIFTAQTTDMAYARVPNGTGDFRIQNPTFNAVNDLTDTNDEAFSSPNILIFPNPARDYISFSETISEVEIRSLDGKLLTKSLYDNRLDISNLVPGLYIIRVTDQNNSIQVIRMVKQ
ncbi:MAG TPA: hypothetical protein DCX89_09620 [Saprospirales bacterium]|nr:hypothetical protein [Saprospirales bacterium]HAY72135.1 hypothetical protein [Saprospirales bacterium]HRQ30497.1 CotH kinase family protein [Saprospiraceae bacterium]